jgi:phage/plasmid-like protein (TIGR03299 family)
MPANVEKMAYAGEIPWHRNGYKVEGLMTWEEAIVNGGIDWEVELRPVFVDGKQVLENMAVVRKTDGAVFNIVGTKYTPIQNRAAGKFLDEVVGTGKARYETVGALDGGKKIWMLMDAGTLDIKGDEIKKYLLMCNSHDGSFAREIFFTGVRVVCMNTLEAARSATVQKFYTRHTKNANADFQIAKARDILGLADLYYKSFKDQMELLVAKQLPAADMPLLLNAAFGTKGAMPAEEIYNPIKIQMDKVEELIAVDRHEFAPEFHGSVYEAYNAVVKFTDYYRNYRGGNADARLNGVWFGGGNIIKARALDWATKYAK